MSKNKKPKKKYTPREVYYPKIIIGIHAMDPIEQALNNVLEKGELLCDDDGIYVYKTFDGQLESFEAGLDIYVKTVERLVKLSNNDFSLNGLRQLREQLIEQDGLDEEVIESAKSELQICKKVIALSPASLIRQISTSIGIERLNQRNENADAVNL